MSNPSEGAIMKFIVVIGAIGAVVAAGFALWSYVRTNRIDEQVRYEHMQHLRRIEASLCVSLFNNEDDCPSGARPQYENVSKLGKLASDVYFLYSEISEYNSDCKIMSKSARMTRLLDMLNQTVKMSRQEEMVFTKKILREPDDKGGYFITGRECLNKLIEREREAQ